jgi:hypothetical protein
LDEGNDENCNLLQGARARSTNTTTDHVLRDNINVEQQGPPSKKTLDEIGVNMSMMAPGAPKKPGKYHKALSEA